MRFGLTFGMVTPEGSGLTWASAVSDLLRLAPELEELGYDSLQLTEHHFQPDGHNPSPLVVLSAVAAVTTNLTLGTNVLLVPLYNPVKLAEDVAVLDNISGGRVTLGVAPGYVVEEFAGLMVPYERRAALFEESMDILQAAWTGETFSHSGRAFEIPETRLSPKPLQQPHPPIWYGVSGPKLLARAAQRGALFVGSPRHSIKELVDHLTTYREAADAVGFVPAAVPIMRGAFLAETTEKAEEIAAPAITHLFKELYGKNSANGSRKLTSDDGSSIDDENAVAFDNFKGRYLIGTPDDVIRRIKELEAATGMTELSCWMQLPGIGGDDVLSSARLFANEVIPAFR